MAVLIFGWLLLYTVVAFATQNLAPYDSSWYDYWGWPVDGPPPGSWEQTATAIFEKPPGSIVPAALVVGISVARFVDAHFRIADKATTTRLRLAGGFSAANVIITVAILFDSLVIDWPLEVGPAPGYAWTIQFLVPDALLVTVLLIVQVWGIPRMVSAREQSSLGYPWTAWQTLMISAQCGGTNDS
jgi:hypothetical protein